MQLKTQLQDCKKQSEFCWRCRDRFYCPGSNIIVETFVKCNQGFDLMKGATLYKGRNRIVKVLTESAFCFQS